ncbi:unnamed protein product [Owenia fusiformis]|uniref:Uncharacterized protein n=1 Tax=Owenia fusiformis TaxID=6347 RepID=A0A8S4N7Y4_OWEFU|nr:unnamed protein product [Owenia fusiformis]
MWKRMHISIMDCVNLEYIFNVSVGVYLLSIPVYSAPTTDCSKFDIRFTREGQPGYTYREFCSNICSPRRNPKYDALCWSDKNVLKHCGKYVDCINQTPEPQHDTVNKFTKYGVPTLLAIVAVFGIATLTAAYKFDIIARIRRRYERTAQEREAVPNQPAAEVALMNGQTTRPVEPEQHEKGELCTG